jgi:hypothetical protein
MISLSMNESEAKLLLIALAYATRHGKEALGDENESVNRKGVSPHGWRTAWGYHHRQTTSSESVNR